MKTRPTKPKDYTHCMLLFMNVAEVEALKATFAAIHAFAATMLVFDSVQSDSGKLCRKDAV